MIIIQKWFLRHVRHIIRIRALPTMSSEAKIEVIFLLVIIVVTIVWTAILFD